MPIQRAVRLQDAGRRAHSSVSVLNVNTASSPAARCGDLIPIDNISRCGEPRAFSGTCLGAYLLH